MIITCPDCGLAYNPGMGHFCQKDLRGRIEKLEKVIESSNDQLQAEVKKHRWIPVSERLPNLNDRNEYDKRINDGTVDVLGWDDGIVFTTNYFPKMDVWNGLVPKKWKLVILPEQTLEGE